MTLSHYFSMEIIVRIKHWLIIGREILAEECCGLASQYDVIPLYDGSIYMADKIFYMNFLPPESCHVVTFRLWLELRNFDVL
jgi:hypothetical protein